MRIILSVLHQLGDGDHCADFIGVSGPDHFADGATGPLLLHDYLHTLRVHYQTPTAQPHCQNFSHSETPPGGFSNTCSKNLPD